jgi:citrate lyase subunit beta / citryl-CoA lyase
VAEAVKARGFGPREVVIRVNAMETPWGIADLEAAVAAGPDAILIPKVSRPGDIVSAAKILAARQAPAETRCGR